MKPPKRVFDLIFTRCPIREVNPEASDVVHTILTCEGGGGFGSSRLLPSDLLGETVFYNNARSIVLTEQQRVQKLRDARDKRRKR